MKSSEIREGRSERLQDDDILSWDATEDPQYAAIAKKYQENFVSRRTFPFPFSFFVSRGGVVLNDNSIRNIFTHKRMGNQPPHVFEEDGKSTVILNIRNITSYIFF